MGAASNPDRYGRTDLYHTDEAASTIVPIYRGVDGWHTRAIGALAADLQWPFVGPLMGGVQRLVPRVQLVLTPPTSNLDIPNEDARSVDLEDSNLFALNRFPGYDRWEDSSRVTYGLEWNFERPNLVDRRTIGQSYRFRKSRIFSRKVPDLTIVSQTLLEELASAMDASSTSRIGIASIKAISPSAATRSTSRWVQSRPTCRLAICG